VTGMLISTSCGTDELRAVSAFGDIHIDGLTLSAPLFPRHTILEALEAPNYPANPETVAEFLATNDPIYSFEEMLLFCSERPPYSADITLPTEGREMTDEEIAMNYHIISLCTYDEEIGFHSKPYWIPQIIIDVDICATELGEGWALMTEEFVASRDDAFFQTLSDTHYAEDTGIDHASFYFSLAVFIEGTDGSLKVANLQPGDHEPARIRQLPDSINYQEHLERPFSREENTSWNEQTIVLRCIKQ